MKILFYGLYLFVLLLFCWGCKSPQDDIRSKIEKMMASHISIPYGQMLLWTKDSIINTPNTQAEFKLVVYTDSAHCSECEMKKIYLWNDFVKLERKYDGHFCVVFIVQASHKNSVEAIISALNHYEVEYPMYVDSASTFSEMNPHIPSEDMYHVFLLDEKDRVVLVGNPLFNSKIENKLLQILEKE